MSDHMLLSPAERDALRRDFFSSLHCALPGNIVSFDPETWTAEIQPAVRTGSLAYPLLTDVPVFMPVPFEILPGDACLVVFADIDVDAWLFSGKPEEPKSARRHSLSDGFAFVGWMSGTRDGSARYANAKLQNRPDVPPTEVTV